LDFTTVFVRDSLSRAKKGLSKVIMPIAAKRAKAGANRTSRRTIDPAKYRVVKPNTAKNTFRLVGFFTAKYSPVKKNKTDIPNS
jgi:hypothetical protein